MDFKHEKKYFKWGLTLFLSLSGVLFVYYFLFHTSQFVDFIADFFNAIMPIIFGLVMAYLLGPVVEFFEESIKWLYVKMNYDPESPKLRKSRRTFAIIFTMILTIFLVYKFFAVVLGEVIVSIQNIINQSPVYIANMEEYFDKFLSRNPDIEAFATNMLNTYSAEINNWLNNTVIPSASEIVKQASLSVLSVAKVLWNLIIGLIVSIYVLGSKEQFSGQFKKIVFSAMSEKKANEFLSDVRYANKIFGSYLSGKIVDSLIIGILCFIFMSIFKLPYAMLISLIVGVTNMIPFFGPFLGAIPSLLLILMVSPVAALKFLILVVCLQQFDGNILGPKILGDSTGLSSFWIIFSITLFGAYFGVIGMAIGVPIFALIYAAIKRRVNRKLAGRGLDVNTKVYMKLDRFEDGKPVFFKNNESFPDRKSEKKDLKDFFKKKKKNTDDEESEEEKADDK